MSVMLPDIQKANRKCGYHRPLLYHWYLQFPDESDCEEDDKDLKRHVEG